MGWFKVSGDGGGYRLARPAAEITVGEIVQVAEGPVAPVKCVHEDFSGCDCPDDCKAKHVWQKVGNAIEGVLNSITLQDLVEGTVHIETKGTLTMSSQPNPERLVYLDHSATTPVRPEVLAAMLPYFANKFGNASSVHRWGYEARQAINDAREKVASLIEASPNEILFTSGALNLTTWP